MSTVYEMSWADPEPSAEMLVGGLSAPVQLRLWLTTSMLCPSGSSTNAP